MAPRKSKKVAAKGKGRARPAAAAEVASVASSNVSAPAPRASRRRAPTVRSAASVVATPVREAVAAPVSVPEPVSFPSVQSALLMYLQTTITPVA